MPVTLESFAKQLADSGILTPGKLKDFLPPNAAPRDAEELARELIKKNHLTKFQAQQVLAGKAKALFLGNYTILDKIGAGGMGQVYKAEHRRMKRLVALKMLPAAMVKDAVALARFQREVEAAAKLRHTNIVAADDADEANGVHFLVMEYVEGQDLSATVKKHGPLPLAKALDYIRQAACGLAFAHGEGVVHRDIKPANLLVDKKGVLKILDMGLARIDQPGGDSAELTGTGAVMGTVDYMAPEQARNTKHADARADIYSLGCSLYYLISGTATFAGDTVVEKILAHRDEPIPSLKDANPGVTDRLQGVFEKMVAKKIDDRYQTMSETMAALELCLSEASASSSEVTGAWQAPNVEASELSMMMGNQNLRSIDTPDDFRIETVKRPPPLSPRGKGARVEGAPPRKNTKLLIGAGAAGFFALLLGVIVIIRNQKGEEIARIEAPAGATVEVKAESGKPKADEPKPPVLDPKPLVPSPQPPASSPSNVVYLDDLPEVERRVALELGKHGLKNDGHTFTWRGKQPAHALFTHPTGQAPAVVVYALDGKYQTFSATIGLGDSKDKPGSPLLFRVLGDGRELWKSPPIDKQGIEAAFAVSVAGLQKLQLEVACQPNKSNLAHAVWIDPRLTPAANPSAPSSASVVYLDDLPEKSYIGLNDRLYKPGHNADDAASMATVFLSESPVHAVMMHPNPATVSPDMTSKAVYDLAKGYSRFQSQVRVRSRVRSAPMFAEVWGDGKRLWESGDLVPRKVGGANVDVDVRGVRELTLIARAEKDTSCAHTLWIEPRLTPISSPQPLVPTPSTADYALKFSGGDLVEIPGLKFDVAQPYTMEVSVTSPTKADKRDGLVCGYPEYSWMAYTKGGHWRWVCLQLLGNKGAFSISNATAHHQRTHLACVHDGPSHRLYVDGKLFESNDFVESKPNQPRFTIGQNFRGIVDELRVSNVARYKKDFTPATSRFETDTNTLGLYHFDEGSGTVLRDSSGHGHDGTITGATWVKADGSAMDASLAATASSPQSPLAPPIDLLGRMQLKPDADGLFRLKAISIGKWNSVFFTREVPDEYVLECDLQRKAGSERSDIVVVVDGHKCSVVLGANASGPRKRQRSGLALVDGLDVDDSKNTTSQDVKALSDDQVSKVVLEVRKNAIRVTVDDQQLIDWTGDPSRLSFQVVDSDKLAEPYKKLALRQKGGELTIHRMILRPLATAVPVANALGSPPNPPAVVYLDDLTEVEWKGKDALGKHGLDVIGRPFKWNNVQPAHALMTASKGYSGAVAAYDLDEKYATFAATVLATQDRGGAFPPLTFRVLGDDRELWKSPPLAPDSAEVAFTVSVAGVRRLQLEVVCPGDAKLARSVWFDPRLTLLPSPLAGEGPGARGTNVVYLDDLTEKSYDGSGKGPSTRDGRRNTAAIITEHFPGMSPIHALVMNAVASGSGVTCVTTLVYDLPGNQDRFQGRVRARSERTLPLFAEVWGDGKQLWDSGNLVLKKDAEAAVDVDVRGVRELNLLIRAEKSNTYAHTLWIEPRLTLVPSPLAGEGPGVRGANVVYLDDLPEKEWKGFNDLGKHGDKWPHDGSKINWLGHTPPHALTTYPNSNGSALVVYDVGGRYERFTAVVGLTTTKNATPLTFRIFGDGRKLWELPPQSKSGGTEFDVDLRGISELRLEVLCPGSNKSAHAVWIEPRLTPLASSQSLAPSRSQSSLVDVLTSPDYEWTKPETLGPEVNAAHFVNSPTLSDDQLSIVVNRYDADGGDKNGLYELRRKSTSDTWGAAVQVAGPGEDQSASLSPDGLKLFTASDAVKGEDRKILVRTRANRDDPWGPPTRLPDPINTKANDSRAQISADGLSLVFNSDRPGSFGKRDVWIARRASADAAWGATVNLGSEVNSDDYDEVDQLLADNKTVLVHREGMPLLATPDAKGNYSLVPVARIGRTSGRCWVSPDGMTMYFDHLNGKEDPGQVRLVRRVPKAASTSSNQPATTIPGAALTFNGHRYLLVEAHITWDQADAKARAMGGHLATVTDQNEDEFLRKQLLAALPVERLAWIGAQKSSDASSWAWVTGEPWSYTSWLAGEGKEPSRAGGADVIFGGAYVKLGDNGFGWGDWESHGPPLAVGGTYARQDRSFGYVVEWDTLGPAVGASPVAPADGDVVFNGHRYRFVSAKEIRWDAAVREAEKLGGHLASITNQAEYAAVKKLFVSRLKDETQLAWLGGSRAANEDWKWAGDEPWGYTDWRPKEPNQAKDSNARLAHRFTKKASSGWTDEAYDLVNGVAGYVVEWDTLSPVGASVPSPQPLAIPAEALTFGGHRYLLVDSALATWDEAKAKAEALGGHLATINSLEERHWVLENVFRKRALTDSKNRAHRMFLGGFRPPSGSPWVWITGEPFDRDWWPDKGSGSMGGGLAWSAEDVWVGMRPDEDQFRTRYFLVEWESPGSASLAPAQTPVAHDPGSQKPLSIAEMLTSSDYVWTEPENLGPTINGPGDELDPSLTNDQLRMFYRRKKNPVGEHAEAVRATVSDPFGPPTAMTTGYRPYLSGDGLTLVYMTGEKNNETIEMMRRPALDRNWGGASTAVRPTSGRADPRNPTLSPDGLALLFRSVGDPKMKTDLWISRRASQAESFGPAASVGPPVNTPDDETFGLVLADGRSLLFRHVRSWYVASTSPTGVQTVVPLPADADGAGLQTAMDFWLSPDGSTAYFSAELPGGLGGADIYVTRRVPKVSNDPARWPFDPPDGREYAWGAPENLGPPINSDQDVGKPAVSGDGLQLVYERFGTIFFASRTALDQPFGEPKSAVALLTKAGLERPRGLYLTPDGLSLYFSARPKSDTTRDESQFYFVRRTGLDAPWGTPARVAGISAASHQLTVSRDELTAYFAGIRPEVGNGNALFTTTRKSIDAPFEAATLVALDYKAFQQIVDPHLMADGRTLVFRRGLTNETGEPFAWARRDAAGKWTARPFERLGSDPSDHHASLTADGRTMFFTSSRPGSLGSNDIWVTRRVPKPATKSAK